MRTWLSSWLGGMDESVQRSATVALRLALPWLLIAASLASSAWTFAHPAELQKVLGNDLPRAARMGALWWLAATAGGLALLHAVVIGVRRIRERRWRVTATIAQLNRLLSFVVAVPLFIGLTAGNMETKREATALLLIVLGAACFVPTIVELTGHEPLDDDRWPSRLRGRLGDALCWLAVLTLWVGYSYLFSRMSIHTHHALITRTIDLGYYDNIFYQSVHGRPLACTYLKGGNHASAHFDPILVLLSPLYLLYPRAELLLVLQSVWIGSGVIPAYLLGRHLLDKRAAGVVLAAAYALHPALHGANMYEFHSLTLVVMPMMWALYFLQRGAFKRYFATLAVLLLIREDVPLLMCFVGAYSVLRRERGYARAGWITVAACVAYFAVIKSVFMTSADILNNGKDSYSFGYYYSEMIPDRTGFGGLLTTLLTNPQFVLRHAVVEEKVVYLGKLFVPVLLLPLWARPGRIMLWYGFLFLLLASRKAVFSTHFQYSMLIVPILLAITPAGLARLRDGDLPQRLGMGRGAFVNAALGALLVSSLLVSWKFGGIVENKSFRGGFYTVARSLTDNQQKRYIEVRRLVDRMEPGASVSVTNVTGPHASNRKEVYFYRQHQRTHYVFVDERELKGDKRDLDQRRERGELELLGASGTIKLYRLVADRSKWKSAPSEPEKPVPPLYRPRRTGIAPGRSGGEPTDDRGEQNDRGGDDE